MYNSPGHNFRDLNEVSQHQQRSSDQKDFLLNQPVSAKAYLFSQPPATVQPSNTESERDRRLRLRAQERANRQAGMPNSAYSMPETVPQPVSLDAQRAELEERQRLLDLKKQEARELEERLKAQRLVEQPAEPTVDKQQQYRAMLDAQRLERAQIQQANNSREEQSSLVLPSSHNRIEDEKRRYREVLDAQIREKQMQRQPVAEPITEHRRPETQEQETVFGPQRRTGYDKAQYARELREQMEQREQRRQRQPPREPAEDAPSPFPSQPPVNVQKKNQYGEELKRQMEEQRERKKAEEQRRKFEEEQAELKYRREREAEMQHQQRFVSKKRDPNQPSTEHPQAERYQQLMQQAKVEHPVPNPVSNPASNPGSKQDLFKPQTPPNDPGMELLSQLPPPKKQMQAGFAQPQQSPRVPQYMPQQGFPQDHTPQQSFPPEQMAQHSLPQDYMSQRGAPVPHYQQYNAQPQFQQPGYPPSFAPAPQYSPEAMGHYAAHIEELKREREKAKEESLEIREMMLREREKHMEGMLHMMKLQAELIAQRNPAAMPGAVPSPSAGRPPTHEWARRPGSDLSSPQLSTSPSGYSQGPPQMKPPSQYPQKGYSPPSSAYQEAPYQPPGNLYQPPSNAYPTPGSRLNQPSPSSRRPASHQRWQVPSQPLHYAALSESPQQPAHMHPIQSEAPELSSRNLGFSQTDPFEQSLSGTVKWVYPETQWDKTTQEMPVISEEFPQGFSHAPQDFSPAPQDFSRPLQDFSHPPEDFSRSPEDFSRPQQDFSRPQQDFSRPKQDFSRSPKDFSRSPKDFSRPPQDYSRPQQDFAYDPQASYDSSVTKLKEEPVMFSLDATEDYPYQEDEIKEQIVIENSDDDELLSQQLPVSKQVPMKTPLYEESHSYQVATPQESFDESPANKASIYSKPQILDVFKDKSSKKLEPGNPPSKLYEARRQAKQQKCRDTFDDIDMVLAGLHAKPSPEQGHFAGRFTKVALSELRSQKQQDKPEDSVTNSKVLQALDDLLSEEAQGDLLRPVGSAQHSRRYES